MTAIILVLLLSTLLLSVFSADLVIKATDFEAEVIKDERVWIIEFYSPMCGSCTEFSPTWEKIEKSVKSMVTAKINIDTPEGLRIAQDLKVLDEGIPSVQLFASSSRETMMAGDILPHKALMKKIKSSTSHLSRRDDGLLIKQAPAFIS